MIGRIAFVIVAAFIGFLALAIAIVLNAETDFSAIARALSTKLNPEITSGAGGMDNVNFMSGTSSAVHFGPPPDTGALGEVEENGTHPDHLAALDTDIERITRIAISIGRRVSSSELSRDWISVSTEQLSPSIRALRPDRAFQQKVGEFSVCLGTFDGEQGTGSSAVALAVEWRSERTPPGLLANLNARLETGLGKAISPPMSMLKLMGLGDTTTADYFDARFWREGDVFIGTSNYGDEILVAASTELLTVRP